MRTATNIALILSWICISDAFTITGVHAGVNNDTGARPFRRNIEEFKHSGPAFDLYIQALDRLMKVDESEKYSYYKIAGIHGYPKNVSWDGVVGHAGGVGYCEHGSVLFPIWHRPYLALFEQMIWSFAQEIANTYPDSVRVNYIAAAITLRIPYWDWSLNSTLPDVASRPLITIESANGTITIDNPLFAYKFHNQDKLYTDLPYLAQYPTSVREPDIKTLQSQNDLVNHGLQNTADYWHDAAYLLFSSISEWNPYSNVAGGGDTSIELLHGGIHNYAGGPSQPNVGHMTFLWYSSFDPIFWLHHTQVDRLVAMWQAINPDSYIEAQLSSSNTYYVPKGTTQTRTYPLLPFRQSDEGRYYTGESVRRLNTFGYSYSELVDWDAFGSNPKNLAKRVTRIVNNLYHPTYRSNISIALRTTKHLHPIGSSLDADHEWKFSIKVLRNAVTDATGLYFFTKAAELSDDKTIWSQNPGLIGSQLFIIPQGASGGRFSPHNASIPLTQALLSLPDLGPSTVLPWIRENVIWRAVDAVITPSLNAPTDNVSPVEGPVAAEQATGYESTTAGKIAAGTVQLSVHMRIVTQASSSDSFPVYGEWKCQGSMSLAGDGGMVNM